MTVWFPDRGPLPLSGLLKSTEPRRSSTYAPVNELMRTHATGSAHLHRGGKCAAATIPRNGRTSASQSLPKHGLTVPSPIVNQMVFARPNRSVIQKPERAAGNRRTGCRLRLTNPPGHDLDLQLFERVDGCVEEDPRG